MRLLQNPNTGSLFSKPASTPECRFLYCLNGWQLSQDLCGKLGRIDQAKKINLISFDTPTYTRRATLVHIDQLGLLTALSTHRVKRPSLHCPMLAESGGVAYHPKNEKPVVLDGMNIVSDRIHTSKECADLDSIAPRIDLLARLLEDVTRSPTCLKMAHERLERGPLLME